MKEFKIAQPQSIEQVTSLLKSQPDTYRLMAGGTDLLDEMKNGIVTPETVIDLNTIKDLAFIRKDQDALKIGSMTPVADLTEDSYIQKSLPGLKEAALSLATPQLRNVGTVGGNLCQRPRCWYFRDPQVECRKKGGSRCYAPRGKNKYHAIFGGGMCYIVYPSDLAPVLISMDANVKIASPNGEKTVPLQEFYTLPQTNIRKENILKNNEVVKEVHIPLAKTGAKSTYIKLKERGTWDFALVSVAINAVVQGGIFKEVKIACGGVAPIPWRLLKMETQIKGKKITEGLLRQAAQEELKESKPLTDNGYKRDLFEVALCRAALSLV